MSFQIAMPWSDGEHRVHELLKVPEDENPTSSFLTPQAAYMLRRAPLLAVGTLDSQDRPWTTIWGGEPGFSKALGGNLMGTRTLVDAKYDPVVEALVGEEFGQKNGNQKMMSGLTLDLATRSRVKLSGIAVAGAVAKIAAGEDAEEEVVDGVGQIQMVTNITQSLTNCPKYMNEKEIRPAVPNPKLVSSSPKLPKEAIELLEKADLFFMSTANGNIDMDSNHRGGPPGFVRVISNLDDGAEIIYPEYSGNRLYQSLGNIFNNPKIGLVVPDFEQGDVLYLTGAATILVGKDASNILPHSNLAIKIKIAEARYVSQGLPFRGIEGERSPYNPSLRLLSSEGSLLSKLKGSGGIKATLVENQTITRTISRYRFKASQQVQYKPGQWVALDFSEELDMGWSHMNDAHKQSLNDDYIRTFTLSSHPGVSNDEFELTARLHGPVTEFLSRQRVSSNPLEIPVMGFGGDFVIKTPDGPGIHAFIAGGVGITPLLGQLNNLAVEKLRLIWILKLEDIDFVVDVFQRHPQLSTSTTIFFTGIPADDVTRLDEKVLAQIETIKNSGAQVSIKRPESQDILAYKAEIWYVCAANLLRKQLLAWLDGRVVVMESFDF